MKRKKHETWKRRAKRNETGTEERNKEGKKISNTGKKRTNLKNNNGQ